MITGRFHPDVACGITGQQWRSDMASVATTEDERPSCNLTLEQIQDILHDNIDALQARGVTSISIFGSRSDYSHRPDSDLDLLIDYDPQSNFSFFDLIRAQRYVQSLVGCKVHMTTRSDLRASSLSMIEKRSVPVY
jgi:uncharacterized protein